MGIPPGSVLRLFLNLDLLVCLVAADANGPLGQSDFVYLVQVATQLDLPK